MCKKGGRNDNLLIVVVLLSVVAEVIAGVLDITAVACGVLAGVLPGAAVIIAGAVSDAVAPVGVINALCVLVGVLPEEIGTGTVAVTVDVSGMDVAGSGTAARPILRVLIEPVSPEEASVWADLSPLICARRHQHAMSVAGLIRTCMTADLPSSGGLPTC